jgi:hypothetical protein
VVKDGAEIELIEALQESNVEKIKGILYSFFASIPSDWYRKNELQDYEGYYASVIYALFNGAGLRTIAEDATNTGRIDLTVLWESNAYVVEFKVVEDKSDGNALSQIKEKRYFEKYVNKYSSVYLIGIEFSKKDRNIVSFDWERL